MVIGGEDRGRKKNDEHYDFTHVFSFSKFDFAGEVFCCTIRFSLPFSSFTCWVGSFGWAFLSFYVLLPLMLSFWCPFFLCSALLGGVFFLYLPIASSYIVVSFYAFFFYFFLIFLTSIGVGG